MAAKKLTPCACSSFEAHLAPTTGNAEFDQHPDNLVILTTNCTRMTHNTFAQGHDAKLVSFLVAWDLGGLEIHSGRNTGTLRSHENAQAAGWAISGPLGDKAARAWAAAQLKAIKAETRANEKANRAAARAEAKANKPARKPKADGVVQQAQNAPEDSADTLGQILDNLDEVIAETETAAAQTTKIKVGRWFYDATIQDGTATYVNGAGSVMQTSNYTLA